MSICRLYIVCKLVIGKLPYSGGYSPYRIRYCAIITDEWEYLQRIWWLSVIICGGISVPLILLRRPILGRLYCAMLTGAATPGRNGLAIFSCAEVTWIGESFVILHYLSSWIHHQPQLSDVSVASAKLTRYVKPVCRKNTVSAIYLKHGWWPRIYAALKDHVFFLTVEEI